MKMGIAVLALAGLLIAAGRGAHDPAPDPPAGLGSILAALQSDLGQLNGDLRSEQADITKGRLNRDGPCYNLVANVDYDVQKVDYHVLTNVTHDRADLVSVRNAVLTDIADLRRDLTVLANDGAGYPDSEGAAISAAHRNIGLATSRANADIAQVNADVGTAYQLAYSLTGPGRCPIIDRPGSRPTPIPRI